MTQIAVTVCSNGAAIVTAPIDGETNHGGSALSLPVLLNLGWTVVSVSATSKFHPGDSTITEIRVASEF